MRPSMKGYTMLIILLIVLLIAFMSVLNVVTTPKVERHLDAREAYRQNLAKYSNTPTI